MSFFATILANKLRNKLLGGVMDGEDNSEDASQGPAAPQSITPPATLNPGNFQMPGFWQSLVDHKLGIDELAPLKAQLLDTQIKEQLARNARYGVENQHADTIFGLTQAEMAAKNQALDMSNLIAKATMQNKIDESGLSVEKSKADVGEIQGRGKYYGALTQEKQLEMARQLGEAVAGSNVDMNTLSPTFVGPQEQGSLVNNFVESLGLDPSQRGIATAIYGPAIAGAISQKQQHLAELKTTNEEQDLARRTAMTNSILQIAAGTADPVGVVERAGRAFGLDENSINYMKDAAGNMKQPMVTPREDSYTKAKGEELQAAEAVRRNLLTENSSDGTVTGMKPKYQTKYNNQTKIIDSIRQELDNYQQGATTRQIPKKAAPDTKGTPGSSTEGALTTTKGVTLSKPVSIVSQYLQNDPHVNEYTDDQLAQIVDYLNKKGAKTTLADLKSQIQAMSNTHD